MDGVLYNLLKVKNRFERFETMNLDFTHKKHQTSHKNSQLQGRQMKAA
jgi:hypothetical protein